MNRIILNSIYLVLFAFVIIGCTQDSDIEIPDSEKRLVVHSVLHPDTTVQVSLTSTRVVASKEEIEDVKDANVELYEDGDLVGSLVLTPPNADRGEQKHKYILDYQPIPGREYMLKAEKSGLKSVQASTIVPQKKGEITKVELVGEFEYGLKNIKVTISDTDSEANFYHLVMYTSSKTTEIHGTDTITYGQPEYTTYYELKNTSFGDGLAEDNRYGFELWSNDGGYVFDDELFNNGTIVYNTNIYLPYWDWSDQPNIIQESKVRIELRTVNEEFFKYQRSLSLQRNAKDNPLAEPVFLYNNIENGFGNFSAYNVASSMEIDFN